MSGVKIHEFRYNLAETCSNLFQFWPSLLLDLLFEEDEHIDGFDQNRIVGSGSLQSDQWCEGQCLLLWWCGLR